MDMWIGGDVIDDVSFHFEWIKGLAFGFRDKGHDLGLVGASHIITKFYEEKL